MTRPRYDLPRHTWRVLHSAFVDWMVAVPTEIRDAMFGRLSGQVTFEGFLLQVLEHKRLDVFVRVTEDDDVRVGLCVYVTDGEDWTLFELTGQDAGVDAAWLRIAGALRLDEELTHLLGSEQ